MKRKKSQILLILLSAILIFGFSIAGLLLPDGTESMSERRKLASFPAITVESLQSGTFMDEFETYAQDQFPLRETFRSLKAITAKYVLQQGDNNGIYESSGHVSKLDYPLHMEKLDRNATILQEVYDSLLADTDCSTYLCIVPDKNYYLAPPKSYPHLDYEALQTQLSDRLSFADSIDIFDQLGPEDYYRTDPHWKQEQITHIADTLMLQMQGRSSVLVHEGLKSQTSDAPFYGAYVGQSALPLQPDTLQYLTNDTLDACTVTSYQTGNPSPALLYDLEKAHGRDPYEMFLCGSDALLTIENPNADTDKELIVFRDSFGSSLIPLLAGNYAKITVVDLRYFNRLLLPQFLECSDQDVLFLYSTMTLNQTISM